MVSDMQMQVERARDWADNVAKPQKTSLLSLLLEMGVCPNVFITNVLESLSMYNCHCEGRILRFARLGLLIPTERAHNPL
jgi:hypothetical protein